jgi:hypothetical protein
VTKAKRHRLGEDPPQTFLSGFFNMGLEGGKDGSKVVISAPDMSYQKDILLPS